MENKIKIERPSESCHWYDQNGNPVYTVIGKNGNERDTTLADARKLKLATSVTTIIDVANKPWLTFYKEKQILLAALTLPRVENEPEEEWIKRVIFDSKKAGKDAADLGTIIHAEVQGAYEGKPYSPEYAVYVERTCAAIAEAYGLWEWECEKSFTHNLGFGGKIDLQIHGHPGVIIDLKTKNLTAQETAKIDFDDNCLQLAAYRVGSGNVGALCANVYISTKVPGEVYIKEYTEKELARGWGMFLDLLNYWKKKKEYYYEP